MSLYLTLLAIVTGSISAGFVIGYASPSTHHLQAVLFPASTNVISHFASIMNIGALIGCLMSGFSLDRIGRKSTLKIASLPLLVGWGFIIYPLLTEPTTINNAEKNVTEQHVPLWYSSMLIFGRFLTGLACGSLMTTASVYLVEIAPTRLRGLFGTCNQLGITIGIFISYASGYLFQNMPLRYLTYVGAVCPLIMLLLLQGCPESPRWLMEKNRRNEALNALKILRYPATNVDDELKDFEDSISNDFQSSGAPFSLKNLLVPPHRSALYMCLLLMIFQQLSGINAVMFFAENIIVTAGGGGNSALYVCFLGLAQVVFTLISVRVVDRSGRKTLLKAASGLMALSLLVLSVYFLTKSSHGSVAVISLIVFILGFSLGWGPIPMLLTAEVFSMRARGTAGGVCIGTSWITSYLVTRSFTPIVAILGAGPVFGLFAASCVASGIYVAKVIPETKGRSLEDIQITANVSKSIV